MTVRHLPIQAWLTFCLLAAGGCSPPTATPTQPSQPAQQPRPAVGLNDVVYFPKPFEQLKRMESYAKEAYDLHSGLKYRVLDLKVDIYRLEPTLKTNKLDMTIESPECVIDLTSHEAESSGPLKAHTGDNRFTIEGTGFQSLLKGSNSVLIISNNVVTTLQKDFLAKPGTTVTNSPSAVGSNQLIRIRADRFTFDREANLITYSGNVRAEDDELNLMCDVVTIRRADDGTIEDLVADRNVVVVSKATGGRTTGEHAVYSAAGGAQTVTLTGNPRWEDGPRVGTARAFVFDRTHDTFRAEGAAHFQLPRESFSTSGIFLIPEAAPPTNATAPSGAMVELLGEYVTLLLAPAGGAVQGIIAETNVIIVDAQTRSRAAANRANYSQTNGLFELLGRATWESGEPPEQRLARGEALIFDATNRTIAARTNAYLKLPVSALGQSGVAAGNPALRGLAGATNLVLEASAGDYEYRGDELAFHDQVRAALLENGTIRGTLESGALFVGLQSNVVRSLRAEKEVHARQLPAPDPRGRLVERLVDTDFLNVQLRTNGVLEHVEARGGVSGSQIETPTNGAAPIKLKFAGDSITAGFLPNTNMVDTALAEGNVMVGRDDDTVTGGKAVYTGTNDTVVLTVNPTWKGPNRVFTAKDAFIYDHKNDIIRAVGRPRAVIGVPVEGLSNATLPQIRGNVPK